MPTARWSPGVLSLQSALVVAGGSTENPNTIGVMKEYVRHLLGSSRLHRSVHCVEIFQSDTSQWYRTYPLPVACYDISLVAIGNTCLALGGRGSIHHRHLNYVFHASIIDLLRICNAVPANQTTHSGSSDTQSAWKALPNTPTYGPTAAVLAGNLLAVGGRSDEYDDTSQSVEIFMHIVPTDTWVYIGTLPPQHDQVDSIAIALSPLEILVVTGSSVHKGTPLLFE